MTPQSSTATGGDPMVGIVEVPLRRKPGAPPQIIHGPIGAPTSTYHADDGTVTVTRFTDEPWYRRPHVGTGPVDEPIGRTVVEVLHGCLAVAEARAARPPDNPPGRPVDGAFQRALDADWKQIVHDWLHGKPPARSQRYGDRSQPVKLARWAARLALRCLHALFDGASPTRGPR